MHLETVSICPRSQVQLVVVVNEDKTEAKKDRLTKPKVISQAETASCDDRILLQLKLLCGYSQYDTMRLIQQHLLSTLCSKPCSNCWQLAASSMSKNHAYFKLVFRWRNTNNKKRNYPPMTNAVKHVGIILSVRCRGERGLL